MENVNTSPFTDKPFLVNTSPAADSLSENAANELSLPTVHPFIATENTSPVAIGAFEYSNTHILVTPGPVNLGALPDGKFLHGNIDADGGCLFSALSFALSGSQSLSQFYRSYALKYISDNPSDFEEDIFMETKKSVEDYVTYMTPHFRFGDQVMVITYSV